MARRDLPHIPRGALLEAILAIPEPEVNPMIRQLLNQPRATRYERTMRIQTIEYALAYHNRCRGREPVSTGIDGLDQISDEDIASALFNVVYDDLTHPKHRKVINDMVALRLERKRALRHWRAFAAAAVVAVALLAILFIIPGVTNR